jgi:hypothetical protein
MVRRGITEHAFTPLTVAPHTVALHPVAPHAFTLHGANGVSWG